MLEREQANIMIQVRDIKHQLANTTQQLNTVLKQNVQLSSQLEDVLVALKGNEFTKQGGIIDRLIAVEEFMTWLKKKRTVLTGWFLGVGFIFGGISALFWGIIKFVGFIKGLK
jgi:hypothetical protein